MYPQQQQPYYLTNPYLLNPSFPVTSDSSLHPPGTDPPSNSTPFPASSIYASQTADYQNWIAQPIGYDLVSTIYSFDLSFRIFDQNLNFFLSLGLFSNSRY